MISPAQAKKLLEVNSVNLAKKVASGGVLTPKEAAMLGSIAAPADPEPVWAPSQSALAELLNVSRQLIGYHARRPASPRPTRDGRYHVAAWRTYLQAFGRVDVAGPSETSTGPRLDFRDGLWAAIEIVERELSPAMLGAGVTVSPDALQLIGQHLAHAIDRCAAKWGFPSYFQVDPAEHP